MAVDRDHMVIVYAAQERYMEAAARLQKDQPNFCLTCGAIGYQLMAVALLEAELADQTIEMAKRAELGAELALWAGLPLPTHRPLAEHANPS